VNDKFSAQALDILDKQVKTFKEVTESIILPNSGWEDRLSQQYDDLLHNLRQIRDLARDQEIDKLKTLTSKATCETIEEIINDPIYSLNDDFWKEINRPLTKELVLVAENCRQILKDGLRAEEGEVAEFIQDFQDEVKKFTNDYIKKLFKDINTNLLRKFNAQFKHDEKGAHRNWVAMEKHQIEELWQKVKADCDPIFHQFKYIKIDWNVMALDSSMITPDGDFLQQPQESDRMARASSMMFSRLLSEVEVNKCKDRFNQDTENALEEAKRK
jgi:hypothetical protein